MQKTQVMDAIDYPEVLIAGGKVDDLLAGRQDDQCREANLGVNSHNVVPGILNDARAWVGLRGQKSAESKDYSQEHVELRESEVRRPRFTFHVLYSFLGSSCCVELRSVDFGPR